MPFFHPKGKDLKIPVVQSFERVVWNSARRDLFLGIPFVPFYALAEVAFGGALAGLLQIIYIETPRIAVSDLVPKQMQAFLQFGQTLDRKNLGLAIPLILIGFGLIKLMASFFSTYFIARAGHRVALDLRHRMLSAFLSSTGNVLDSKNPDITASQLMQDTSLLQSSINKGMLSVIRDGFLLVVLFVVGFFISAKIFSVSLIIIVPLALLIRKVSGVMNYYARESALKQVYLSARALQTKNGLLTVHGLRSQMREYLDFSKLANAYYKFVKKSFFVRTVYRPGVEVGGVLLIAGMMHWKLTHAQNFDSPTFSLFLAFFALAFKPLKNVGNFLSQLPEVQTVYGRLKNDWMSYHPNKVNSEQHRRSLNRELIAETLNVTYETQDGAVLLKDCSVQLKKGLKIALVGESGAGKTTFVRVLAGLLLPKSGTVLVDSDFLYTSQTPYVFKGKVRENIIYASAGEHDFQTEDKLQELILSLSLAHSDGGSKLFVEKKVGLFGDGLSGGERARVALARALFPAPNLLLLDEPTANLDADSAKSFWAAVEMWRKQDSDRTVVAVSHSINEIKSWDVCYVFEKGRIIASGKPAEILDL